MDPLRPRSILARGIVLRASRFPEARTDVAVELEAGRIAGLAARRSTPGQRGVLDLSDCVLFPGLVNAHAHLELGVLAGRLPRDQGFGAWVGALMRARAEHSLDELAEGARQGLCASLAAGVTTVGDIASTDALAQLAPFGGDAPHPRVRLHLEVIDAWDPSRTAGALARAREAEDLPRGLLPGLSPHAPFTVSAALMAGVAELRGELPVAIHWSETPEEDEWLRLGTGPWADVLGTSPRTSGLELIEAAGLLGPHASLIHANVATRRELERVARAGASVVHCPGTHAFFGRPLEDLALFTTPGLDVAVGTDSLASNDSLDLVAELRRMADYPFGLGPLALFEMATLAGARAVGLEGEVGALEPGFRADAVALALPPTVDPGDADSIARAWLEGEAEVRGVLVGGAWFETSASGI